jgi:molybdopterin converting factor small subunit
MKVEILCFGAMKEYLPAGGEESRTVIELDDGATVADGIDALGAPKGLVHAILVNEDPADLARRLDDGDRLTLMPHYSGGGA